MRYVIKERFWSWGDKYYVYNEHQDPVYEIVGKVFSWGDQLSFRDMQGNELAYISQRLLSWMPCYEIYLQGELFAVMRKKFTWFQQKFVLDIPGPNDYTIDGSFWVHNYAFQRQGRTVAKISKAFWAWTDSYGIETVKGEDDVTILCACIVIDQILDDQRSD
ncbi:hypothetical protein DTL42_21445 [Bremerella cremea]|uniref:LURP-one-related family protein n=1 Tax=Bremerella cremea TaxID=1031537 RepID=A0A368KMT3_9BACT|nr:LURP-one-related family protein [Bremerella cremea]RCS41142.1 hypothetical protein DTL42_21445 [Bremerella cremea]